MIIAPFKTEIKLTFPKFSSSLEEKKEEEANSQRPLDKKKPDNLYNIYEKEVLNDFEGYSWTWFKKPWREMDENYRNNSLNLIFKGVSKSGQKWKGKVASEKEKAILEKMIKGNLITKEELSLICNSFLKKEHKIPNSNSKKNGGSPFIVTDTATVIEII